MRGTMFQSQIVSASPINSGRGTRSAIGLVLRPTLKNEIHTNTIWNKSKLF